ncbi:MAG: sodium:proton antiporter [Prevotella sp.]|nr:sodium:proton antiporter [Prevotella sp.]
MTLIIVAILALCYLLIASEYFTNINKAAVAIFTGTVGWVLYACYVDVGLVQSVFLRYFGRASEIVIFLLVTMTIVEVLNNNGCFDFIRPLLKTRNSKKMLWSLGIVTFFLSAHLENLTVTVMMLTLMHELIANRRQRILFGSAIVIAANCGGAITVIGEPTGLLLWNLGAVSASGLFLKMFLPCLVAWALPTFIIGRMLPERCDTETIVMPYRGDDTRLKVWQRILMLFVGIGGLWFIPSFRNITQLSPFLGALCVLALLWIVNELFNHRLLSSNLNQSRRVPSDLQYGVVQMILYVMGFLLAVGVVTETGAVEWFINESHAYIQDSWLMGCVAAVVSVVLDNFATAVTFFSLSPQAGVDDPYWAIIAFSSAIGGNVLAIGSLSGIAFLRMEHVRVVTYFKTVGTYALLGLIAGYLTMFLLSFS